MTPKIRLLPESVTTKRTLIGLFELGVSPFVHPQIVRLAESEIAVKTLEWASV